MSRLIIEVMTDKISHIFLNDITITVFMVIFMSDITLSYKVVVF